MSDQLMSKEKLEAILNDLHQKAGIPSELISNINTIDELSEGNVNQVFRVKLNNNFSFIVKYSPPFAYRYQDISIASERNAFEVEVLKKFAQLNEENFPVIYYYSPKENFTIMQDLNNCIIMREALIEGKIYKNFADQMIKVFCRYPDYNAKNEPYDQINLTFQNGIPELQVITKEFVFQHPFGLKYPEGIDCLESNFEWVKEHVFNNNKLLKIRSDLEHTYYNKQETLIHGDLHTGSIMLNDERTYLIDPEFARIGPISFDIGMLIANLIMSALAAEYHLDNNQDKKQAFQRWLIECISILWNNVIIELNKKEYDVDLLKKETIGYCALEIIRRTIGAAKIKDFLTISNSNSRSVIERKALNIAVFQLIEAENPDGINQSILLLKEAIGA